MKRKKTIIVLIISFSLSVCMTLMIINFSKKINNSKEVAKEFCSYLVDDDIESAKKLLHPDGQIKQEELQNYIFKLEERNSIDFSNGLSFGKVIDYSHTYYDGAYNGSVHSFTYEIIIDGKTIEASFTIIDNHKGYGIDAFTISNK